MQNQINYFINSKNTEFIKIKGISNLESKTEDKIKFYKIKFANQIVNYILKNYLRNGIAYYYLPECKNNLIKSVMMYFNEEDRDLLSKCNFNNLKFLQKFAQNCNELMLNKLFYIILFSLPSINKSKELIETNINYLEKATEFVLKNIDQYPNLKFNFKDYIILSKLMGCWTFQLAYLPKKYINIQKQINQIQKKIFIPLNYTSNIKFDNNKDRKINIAFMSNLLTTQHSVTRDRSGIINNIDRDKFNVFYIVFSNEYSDLLATNLYKQSGKNRIVLNKNTIESNVRILESLKLDILIYCEIGMDMVNYMYASMRIAPIQCVTWGHSNTSGISTIDYYLSSKLYEISDIKQAQENYSEKLYLGETLSKYYYNPLEGKKIDGDLIKKNLKIDYTKKLYGCLQSPYKLSVEYDHILKSILETDNDALILLTDFERVAFQRILQPRFIKTIGSELIKRIIFIPTLGNDDYLSLISLCDVIIDTYPFGSCNSSIDSFMLGKPVITLPSDYLSGRFTYGFYLKMGITDLVAHNSEQYVELAVKAANNKEWIEPIKELILKKNIKLLEDSESVTEFEFQMRDIFDYYIENGENMKG